MPAPLVRRRTFAEIKSKILRPALTSHYEVSIGGLNSGITNWIRNKSSAGLGRPYDSINQELITLSCSEATLPGSSLITHEINNDFTGVTERHVYRRQYDDRADFTFFVDHDYNIIHFFENWISYTCNQQLSNQGPAVGGRPGLDNRNHNYRVNFPNDYKTDGLYITKFEKDYSGRNLTYQFINAFPISITSMPISYDQSDLLKCTVSFTYSRYVISSELSIRETTTEPEFGPISGFVGGIPETPDGAIPLANTGTA
jgi:hypothetical protein